MYVCKNYFSSHNTNTSVGDPLCTSVMKMGFKVVSGSISGKGASARDLRVNKSQSDLEFFFYDKAEII